PVSVLLPGKSLHRIGGQRHALPAAEQRQQHLDPRTRLHAGINRKLPLEWTAQDFYGIAKPRHAGGLERALAAVLEPRLVPLPAGRHMLRLRMIKSALHVADDATEDAVADQLPPQRGSDRGNERVAVGRV